MYVELDLALTCVIPCLRTLSLSLSLSVCVCVCVCEALIFSYRVLLSQVRETFDVVLLSPSVGAALSANTRISVTITENGDPNGRIGFSCLSRYGGLNADGASDAAVVLTVNRLGGTIGAVSVRVSTALSGTTASSEEYVALDTLLFFQANETTRTITLHTHALLDPLVSKQVVVVLDRPTGGAVIDTNMSSATVTIYATSFTAEIISRVQVCSDSQ